MSRYIQRWCEHHGDWDEDVDNPAEGCPICIEKGMFKTRQQLERELAELRSLSAPPWLLNVPARKLLAKGLSAYGAGCVDGWNQCRQTMFVEQEIEMIIQQKMKGETDGR